MQQKVIDLENNRTSDPHTFQNAVDEKDHAFTIVGILTVLRSILSVVKFFAFVLFCRKASINLHKKMALAIIGSTMLFFDTHFIGNVLNRLSYDLNSVDEVIPFLYPALGNVSQ